MSAGQTFRRKLAAASAIGVALSIASCGSTVPTLGKSAPAPETILLDSANSLKVAEVVATDVVPSDPSKPSTTLSLDDPNRFVIVKNFFEAEQDAPFPALIFHGTNGRGIVTPEVTYLITAGRNGIGESGKDPAIGTFWIELSPTGSPETKPLPFLTVKECPNPVWLLPGDVSDPTTVPFVCGSETDVWYLNAVDLTYSAPR